MPLATPDSTPTTTNKTCAIPDDEVWRAFLYGALLYLTKAWVWEQVGTLTPNQCADYMAEWLAAFIEDTR
jgi:hypothetical protein